MRRRNALLLVGAFGVAGCRTPTVSPNPPDTSVSANEEQTISLSVMSGRPQPPPQDFGVRVGTPVTVRVVGLGPARAAVFGPDGMPVATVDAPLRQEGGIIGTEQRFTPGAAGSYRIEHAEVAGLVLARLNAS
jgi:hypothetical protein